MAMLLMLVGVTLTTLLVPMALTQAGSTRLSGQTIQALHAAQAGLDVGVAHIRTADDSSGNGVVANLPCGSLTGRVSAGSTASYTVEFYYLTVDPAGHDYTWIKNWVQTNNMATCPLGTVPLYAWLRSTGTDQTNQSSRTMVGTYKFRISNQNIPGGLIHSGRGSAVGLCLDAGSDTPVAGKEVRMELCAPGSNRQKFIYDTNLNLVLASSRTTANPKGMCLDAGTPHTTGAVVKFQQCVSATLPQQQWSFNDAGDFEGTTNGVSLDGYCFNQASPDVAGTMVILGNVSAGKCRTGTSYIAVQPEPAVGAGAAGTAVGAAGEIQLVNFNQFGRCLDVTEFNVNYGFLIAWPCKQAPDMAYVGWNQKWSIPTVTSPATSATGRITTVTYCLRSPGSTAAGQYVQVVTCPVGTPTNMTWTVYRDTGNYSTSYRIVDGYGYCLSTTDPTASPGDFYSNGYKVTKITVAVCDGSTLQKWNAPPEILNAVPLKNIGED
jgi:Ricin-type beta-trefoil lectin domain